MKTLLTTTALALALILSSVSSARADIWFPDLQIMRVGLAPENELLVKLKGEGLSANGDWFRVALDRDAAMALLLTALSTGRTLKIRGVEPTETEYGLIRYLYVNM